VADKSGKTGAAALVAALVIAATALFVQPWEGRRHTPYYDIVGVLTVCDGHTGKDIEQRIYSDAECDAFLKADLAIANSFVRKCIVAPLTKNQETSLTSAAYNIGPRVVCGSTLQRKANAGQPFCAELLRWDMAGGKKVKGLTRRRQAEYKLCEAK
jgi:lysozyme